MLDLLHPLTLAAAPSYLEIAGIPNHPEDLEAHNCLTFNRMKAPHSWRFSQGRRTCEIPIDGTLTADQGDTLVEYAAAGAGVVLMPAADPRRPPVQPHKTTKSGATR